MFKISPIYVLLIDLKGSAIVGLIQRPITRTTTIDAPANLRVHAALWAFAPVVQVSSMSKIFFPWTVAACPLILNVSRLIILDPGGVVPGSRSDSYLELKIGIFSFTIVSSGCTPDLLRVLGTVETISKAPVVKELSPLWDLTLPTRHLS